MRTSDLFPSKYLKAEDAKAKQIVATISYMKQELVGQGQDQKLKPVLYLENQKPIVLNKTNFAVLEEAFGDSEDWPGHKIKIRCEKVGFGGKRVDGLRFDPVVPKRPIKDDLEDEIPDFGKEEPPVA
jgi:hypothetical protein